MSAWKQPVRIEGVSGAGRGLVVLHFTPNPLSTKPDQILQIGGGLAGSGVAAVFFRDPFVALTSVLPGMAALAALVHFALQPNPVRGRPTVTPEDLEAAVDPADVLGAGGEEIEAKLKGDNDPGDRP